MLEEGGHLETNYAPVDFLGDQGMVIGARFVRTRQGEPDRDGRRAPVNIPGLGTRHRRRHASSWRRVSSRDTHGSARLWGGNWWRKTAGWRAERAQETSHAQYFRSGRFCAGSHDADPGDRPCQGMRAKGGCLAEWHQTRACACARWPRFPVQGARRPQHRPDAADERHPDPSDADVCRSRDRKLDAEVETGYSADAGREGRGLAVLSLPLQIRDRGRECVLCDECLKVKPVEGCIVEIASLATGRRGPDYRLYQSGKGQDRLAVLQPAVDRPKPVHSLWSLRGGVSGQRHYHPESGAGRDKAPKLARK